MEVENKVNFFRQPTSKRERTVSLLLISFISLSVAFIFSNSLLPPSESAEQSGWVANFIRMLLPEGNLLGDFIIANIRKIAHAVEFGMLGSFVAAFSATFGAKWQYYHVTSILFGLVIGFLDESLQMCTGRGPMILDVWIDLGGYTALYLIIFTCVAAIRAHRRSKE